MNNRIEILSGIAQDIIDSCTMRRAKLLAKKSKIPIYKKPFFKVALAAVLCIAIGLPLLWILFSTGKQVPVYQGMTLSSEPPVVAENSPSPYRPIALYDSLTPQYAVLAHKEQGFHDNRPGQTLTDAEGNPLSPEAGESIFYANQNEDFYITVHIDNPDNFEIVSFTLNGKKYSSYMFEDGSDMENLILKCNVGDASGIVEYTIDAIKYIDGTAIKDVRLEGDQTVKVGVYTENQPIAMIGTPTTGFSEISFDLSINDPTAILGLLDSEVSVVLYRENTAIDSQSVSIADATAVRFTGLDDGAEYRIAVIASYDAFDGAGKTEHTIGERTVTTPTIVTPQVSGISYTEAVAKLKWHNDVADKTAVSFALYKGSEKIRDLNGNEIKLTDLLSGTEYTLKMEYMHDGAVKSREVKFTTKTVDVPTLAISDLQPDLYSVSFKLNENDPLDLLTVNKIELKQGDAVVATANGTSTEFTDLELLQTYTIEVTYTYDLLNGSGTQTKVVKQSFGTQSKGLQIEGGKVTGIGTCTDTKIYVNMPIGDNAFESAIFTEVVLGDGTTSIGSYAFSNCYQLKEINIPNSVSKLRTGTFSGCRNLTEITLPDSVTVLDNSVFAGCEKLAIIHLPAEMTSIGNSCFSGTAITEITIPDGITKLPSEFISCNQLTKVNLPNSLKEIDSWAFWNCFSLKTLSIPDSVEMIKNNAFSGCYNVTVQIPASVKTIEANVFSGDNVIILTELESKPSGWQNYWADETVTVIWNFKEFKTDSQGVTYTLKNDGTAEVVSYEGKSKNIVLGVEGYTLVGKIPSGLFKYNSYLESIIIPEGITEIGHDAFNGCDSLESVTLPDELTRIGAYAFAWCSSLQTIEIPESVTEIENYAFSYLGSCEIVTKHPSEPAGWDYEWADESVSVIWNCKELKTDSQGVTYALKNDGTAEVVSYEGKSKNIVLGVVGYKLIGKIPSGLFSDNSYLESIIIPEGITEIGNDAFNGCDSLESVIIPEGITEIGNYAFCRCYSLKSVTLPDELVRIGEFAFCECFSLQTIEIPESVTEIENYAFSYLGSCEIVTKHPSKPTGWHDEWADESVSVIWGYTG